MGNRRRKNAKDVAASGVRKERADRVFRLKCQGLSYRKIGELVGISDEQARRDFDAAVKDRPLPELDSMRTVADQNLRDVMRWMRKVARSGDPEAANAFTKAITQHAKIFGYEAPKKSEVTGKDGGPITVATAPTIMIPPERESPNGSESQQGQPEGGAGPTEPS